MNWQDFLKDVLEFEMSELNMDIIHRTDYHYSLINRITEYRIDYYPSGRRYHDVTLNLRGDLEYEDIYDFVLKSVTK